MITLPKGMRPSSERIHNCSGVAFSVATALARCRPAARALDQQRAQVGVATTADFAQSRMPAYSGDIDPRFRQITFNVLIMIIAMAIRSRTA